jgi:hypothetical protein
MRVEALEGHEREGKRGKKDLGARFEYSPGFGVGLAERAY